jgi:hypothetical protein
MEGMLSTSFPSEATDFPQTGAPGVDDIDNTPSYPKPVLVPVSDPLATFRTVTGIDSTPSLTTARVLRRPAPNVGIYGRVVHAEASANLKYKTFTFLINGCLGLQIIVAAALTALGAGRGPHGAVTAFGAVNIVIAGFLTYLKGSGLPNRQKHDLNKWRNVREYIEQRERDFCREGCALDVDNELAIIEEKYHEVRTDLEANVPDSFISVSDIHKSRDAGRQQPIVDSTRPRTDQRTASNPLGAGLEKHPDTKYGSEKEKHLDTKYASEKDRTLDTKHGDDKV